LGIATLLICVQPKAVAQVYKIVDENGHVTYTDQAPEDGAAPMELPDISVVDTDYPDESVIPSTDVADTTEPPEGKTPRELRQIFQDFRIIRPLPEESFFGTSNVVVISWGAGASYEPGMAVSVMVDGQAHAAEPQGNLSLTLDRGEHQVFAILRDQRGRRIVTTPIVTFFVKQGSANFNPS